MFFCLAMCFSGYKSRFSCKKKFHKNFFPKKGEQGEPCDTYFITFAKNFQKISLRKIIKMGSCTLIKAKPSP